MKKIKKLLGSFTFCFGIGKDQITPEYQTINFWEIVNHHEITSSHLHLIKPKMFNVKPQPFSVQIRKKK